MRLSYSHNLTDFQKPVIPSPAEIHTDPGDDITPSCQITVVAMEMRCQKTTDCADLRKNGPGAEERGCEDRVDILSEDMQRGHVSLGLRDSTHSHSHTHLHAESGLSGCQVTPGDSGVEEALSSYVRGIQGEQNYSLLFAV